MDEIHPIQLVEDPLLLHWQEGGFSAVKHSDFYSRRELHRTRVYDLLLKPTGTEDALGIRLRISPFSRPKLLYFDRGGSDFSERDRAVLDLLNPHLVQLYRASESRRRLRTALALHESSDAAIVLLEADDRIDFASRAAHELLDRYFGEHGVKLPDALTSWLRDRRNGATAEPLRVELGERALAVELIDGALLLDDQRRMPPLTRRELEILDIVGEGKTNAEIAERLWVSPLTIRKHLENVYAKLGVHTRTAAAAFVRELPVDTIGRRSAGFATPANQDN
jgi:DNA-binding CsgD family transcriptional regulator